MIRFILVSSLTQDRLYAVAEPVRRLQSADLGRTGDTSGTSRAPLLADYRSPVADLWQCL